MLWYRKGRREKGEMVERKREKRSTDGKKEKREKVRQDNQNWVLWLVVD